MYMTFKFHSANFRESKHTKRIKQQVSVNNFLKSHSRLVSGDISCLRFTYSISCIKRPLKGSNESGLFNTACGL